MNVRYLVELCQSGRAELTTLLSRAIMPPASSNEPRYS